MGFKMLLCPDGRKVLWMLCQMTLQHPKLPLRRLQQQQGLPPPPVPQHLPSSPHLLHWRNWHSPLRPSCPSCDACQEVVAALKSEVEAF